MPDVARPLAPRVTAMLAAFAALGGLLALAGWFLDVPGLTDWGGSGISMQPNTALCAALAGAALLALPRHRAWAVGLGLLVGAIGGLTLLEHVLAVDFGIDELLLPERTWGSEATVAKGRMGPPASASFTLLGAAIALATRGRWGRAVAAGIGVVAVAIASLSIVGFLYGARPLVALPRLTAIAAPTAWLLLALATALLAALPEVLPCRALVGSSSAAKLVRRALPFTILVPLAVGWLRVQGQEQGVFDYQFGAALRTLVEAALLIGLLLWSAAAVRNHEQSLADSRQRLEDILASTSDQFLALDRDGRVTYVNQSLRRLLASYGVDAGTLLGCDPVQRFPVLTELPAVATLRAAMAARRSVELEVESPEWGRWFSLRGGPTPGGGFAIVAMDVTERRRSEAALRASEAALQEHMVELREADRRKDEFLAMLAHELRNPLAPLRNLLEVMRRTHAADAALQSAHMVMSRQLAHLTRLVDDLLDVSRIRTGRIVLRPDRVDLAAVIRHAVEVATPNLAAAKHQLHVELPAQPVHVHGDPTRLEQVVGNLLDNACKYTPAGGDGRIALRLRVADGHATIVAEDNGIGVPPALLDGIFAMFAQVDRSMARAQGGLGIGLSLVKRLVEMHGGTVAAQSGGHGQGCTFTVRLPLAAGPEPVAPAADVRGPAAALSRGCRILVVDDNRDAATSLAMLLELAGNVVRTAHDGVGALGAAAAFQPEVVLLDLGMPHMDGLDVARALRARPQGARLLLIAVTGWGDEQDRQLAKAAGFDAHLVKPLDPDELARLFDRLLPPQPAP